MEQTSRKRRFKRKYGAFERRPTEAALRRSRFITRIMVTTGAAAVITAGLLFLAWNPVRSFSFDSEEATTLPAVPVTLPENPVKQAETVSIQPPKPYHVIRTPMYVMTDVEQKVKDYADYRGVSYMAYPQELIALLERNPETEEFVLGYPFRKKVKPDISGYDRTKGVPLFMQWDPQWGYEIYGSDVMGLTGCGPTCLAMVGYYLTGDPSFTPDRVAEFAMENGYYIPGQGSAWALFPEGGARLGLDIYGIPISERLIMENLTAGHPIICTMGPGYFTTAGHFIVLTGLKDGKITVNDPNRHCNSERTWEYGDIVDQICSLWVAEKGAS